MRAKAVSAVKGERELPEAGDLLAVEAIDRTGLIVTSEGAFVRIFRVVPPNPLLMSAEERAKTAATFQRLIAQLKADEIAAVLCRRAAGEPRGAAGRLPARSGGKRRPRAEPRSIRRAITLALAQWRLYAALEESLRMHADAHAAVQVRCHVVVPFLPRQNVARAALAWARRSKLPTVPLERPVEAHRRAVREHLAHVDSLRGELEAEGMPTELLDGEEVVRLLWERFNPGKADSGRRPTTVEVLGELDASTRPGPRAGGRAAATGGHRPVEPGLPQLAPARDGRPRRRADDHGGEHRGAHPHGLAARGDADPPAVHDERVRARARAPARAPETEARLPAAVHDQPRRGAARANPRLRPLRAGARVPAAAARDGGRRSGQPVPGLHLPDDSRPRPGAQPDRRWPRRSTTAPSRSSQAATARSTGASSARPNCGRRACR